MSMEKLRLARPSPDQRRFLEVMRSAEPTTRGPRPMASRGKASVPSRMTNSSMRTAVIGAPTSAIAESTRIRRCGPQPDNQRHESQRAARRGPPGPNVECRGDCKPCGGPDSTFGRRSVGSMQGRPPDPQRPSRRLQGRQILANLVIPAQQLSGCPRRSFARWITSSPRSLQLGDQRDRSAAGGSAPDRAAARLQG